MCHVTGDPRPHVHAHGREQCCCQTGGSADEEIRTLEEQKTDLLEIISRIDAKIRQMKGEDP